MTMKKAEHNTSYICNIASQSYCNFAYMTMYALIVRPHQAGACITMFEMITVTSAVPLAVCTSSCCCEIRRKLHSQAASGCLGWLCMLPYEIGVMISVTDMYAININLCRKKHFVMQLMLVHETLLKLSVSQMRWSDTIYYLRSKNSPIILRESFSLLAGQTQVSRNGNYAVTCKFIT